MEIRSNQPAQPSRGKALQTDFTRSNREGIERALEQVQGSGGDRIELSAAGRNLTKDLETVSSESSEHRRRVAELREQYEEGTLNTPARIERAAEGLLGSTR